MLIYHYTQLGGFHGIVSSGGIYGTAISYLNDSTEFLYLYRLLVNEVAPEFFEQGSPEYSKLVNLAIDQASFKVSQGVFVSCFCGNRDLLSQWRAYAPGAVGGVALGFDVDMLRELMRSEYSIPPSDPSDPRSAPDFMSGLPTCKLERCIYGQNEQRDLLRRKLKALVDHGTDDMTMWIAATMCGLDAARVKHPSFSEEDEWRLIYEVHHDKSTIDFRVGKSMLVPFVTINLSSILPGALKEVVVGPNPHESLSTASINGFLAKHGLNTTRVVYSEIPYRD